MSTIRNIKCKCPLCNEEFTEIVQGSCTIFGLKMDSMPYGAAIVPNPIVRCPGCGFIDCSFSKEEKKLLIEYLKDNKVNNKEPRHYTLAKQYEFLNRDDKSIAKIYLNAFWESLKYYSFYNHDEKCSIALQKLTIDKIDKIKSNDFEFVKFQLIKLDLIRRLGDFDKGLSLIDKITNDLANSCSDEIKKFLKIEEDLIKNKDIDIHTLEKNLGKPLFGSDGQGMIFMFC